MTFFKSLLKLLKEGEKIRVFKTVYCNFKLFPFSKAKHLPLFIYGKAELNIARGAIELCPSFLSPGLIKVGCHKSHALWGKQPAYMTVVNILGHWMCKGAVQISNGTLFKVGESARLITGHDVHIGPNCKLVCEKAITMGRRIRISWESQIFDTDFHYAIRNNTIHCNKAPVAIGDYCWIGNRVTVMKGSVLPNKSVVASNSMVNKDFGSQPEGCLVYGMPANCKPVGIHRLFADGALDADISKYFEETGETSISAGAPAYDAFFRRSLEYKDSVR